MNLDNHVLGDTGAEGTPKPRIGHHRMTPDRAKQLIEAVRQLPQGGGAVCYCALTDHWVSYPSYTHNLCEAYQAYDIVFHVLNEQVERMK